MVARHTSRMEIKVIYASSNDRFKREKGCCGNQVELQATDPIEMGISLIKGRAN